MSNRSDPFRSSKRPHRASPYLLQVEILDLAPRVNPSTNKTYGSNAAASWGYQFRAGFLDGRQREMVTIYEIIKDEDSGEVLWAVPDYQFE